MKKVLESVSSLISAWGVDNWLVIAWRSVVGGSWIWIWIGDVSHWSACWVHNRRSVVRNWLICCVGYRLRIGWWNVGSCSLRIGVSWLLVHSSWSLIWNCLMIRSWLIIGCWLIISMVIVIDDWLISWSFVDGWWPVDIVSIDDWNIWLLNLWLCWWSFEFFRWEAI
jgi:hypothetical protein